MKFDTMFFDLDGTIVDSAPDLVAALNVVLAKYNRRQVNYADARSYVSKGSGALIKFGFNISENNENFAMYHKELLIYYEKNCTQQSKLFDGIVEIIESLNKWAIITNKPKKLTNLLLEYFNIYPDLLVCGDTLTKNKPNSLPILYAMDKLNIDNSLMVGDDAIDVLSAKNANIKSVMVSWGYGYTKNADIDYDYLINHPYELKKWIV